MSVQVPDSDLGLDGIGDKALLVRQMVEFFLIRGRRAFVSAVSDARVELNLVGHGADRAFGQEPIQVGRLKVGYADRPNLSGLNQLLERLPCGDILVALR